MSERIGEAAVIALGGGLGLLATADFDVAKERGQSALRHRARRFLNSARQTGSMIGVAVFGALIAKDATFMAGLKVVVALAAGVLARSAAIAMAGKRSR